MDFPFLLVDYSTHHHWNVTTMETIKFGFEPTNVDP